MTRTSAPNAEYTTSEPSPIDLIGDLRRAVGLFDGAMPITPKEAWEQALRRVAQMRCSLEHRVDRGYLLVVPCHEHAPPIDLSEAP